MERFHQTLKKWLAHQPRATTLTELQTQLDTFRAYYNTVRPHRALGRRTPQQAHATQSNSDRQPTARRQLPHSPRPHRQQRQAHHAPQQPPTPHRSRRHAGTNVLVPIHDRHIRVATTDGKLLRELHLDPTKDYQPQPKP
ncbi:transposase [Mycobacterium noviomagense]|uniref:transposase n=1 Tax=Mycobacterium noviomagense TaxID=459858 RepID=UPI001E33BBE8|nr:transposase [Mycobacterium noviomagense]